LLSGPRSGVSRDADRQNASAKVDWQRRRTEEGVLRLGPLEARHEDFAQRTLRHPIGCVGTGLHTGARVSLTLHPSAPDSGIRFLRYDRRGGRPLPARFDQVCDTTMCTTLGEPGGLMIATVEHLMASLAICEVDNVLVEVGGPELPIMDGSAAPFVFLIECAGVVEQDRPRLQIEVLKPVTVSAHGKFARLEPADGFEVACEIRFDHPLIHSQAMRRRFSADEFKTEIARARTFGFAERVEELWSRGLALGGSLNNAVVVSRDRVLNEEGLRYPDEFVRHKILDSIGDLYLAGGQLIGRFTSRCAGHTLHNRLLRALFADPTAWRVVDGYGPVELEPPARRAALA
jgi:UDP-3-O-[3-hydroxymyristoyl] N-acetylglucosamine deacetylase